MASAINGSFVSGSDSKQDLQQPSSISKTILRLREISPARIVANFGMMLGFLTIY